MGLCCMVNREEVEEIDAQVIYDLLGTSGMTRAGKLGLLANMKAESGLKENIVQRGTTKLTDEQYTAAVDNGLLGFEDARGYGLCQWTFGQRKRSLLKRAQAEGVSVGDGRMQVAFCIDELKNDFPKLFSTLCSSDNIDECTDLVCTQFERPAVNNLLTRRAFAHEFDEQISEHVEPQKKYPFDKTGSIATMQTVLVKDGYFGEVDGCYSREFGEALILYAHDVKETWEGN